jgi:Ca2+-binding RTX toxin-like protein
MTTSLDVTSATPDTFILAGSGYNECAINTAPGGGNNVLDAGAGSDFLTGGAGNNSFYLDARNLSTNQWDTVSDLHSGDGVTVWGVTTSDFALTWLNGQGAPGHTGLTAVFVADGKPEVGVTLTGYSAADLTNGRLAISYGKTEDLPGLPGSVYINIAAT